MIKRNHAIGVSADNVHVVLDENDCGGIGRDGIDHAVHGGEFLFCRNAGGRFVQQQQFRPTYQCHRDIDQLAYAARSSEIGRSARSARPNRASNSTALSWRRARPPANERTDRSSSAPETATVRFSAPVSSMNNCGIWNEREMPSRATFRGERLPMSAAVERDRAAVRLEIAGDHVDEGGLAGAVGADQADLLAGGDIQRQRIGGDDRAEALFEPAHRKHGCHGATSLSRRRSGAGAGCPLALSPIQSEPMPRGRNRMTASRKTPSTSCQVLGR